MAHTKFILSIDKVLDPVTCEIIVSKLCAFQVSDGLHITVEMLEPELSVSIERDTDPSNPRDDDNVGVMHCSKHYGDKNAEDPRGIDAGDIALQLPIYMYDHGDVTVSHKPFSCQWDSGQLGVHYITKAKADEEWGVGKWTTEQLTRILEGELTQYDDYIQGNVWGFQVSNENGEITDSCWGFYGDKLEDTGILDHLEDALHDKARKAWEDRSYG